MAQSGMLQVPRVQLKCGLPRTIERPTSPPPTGRRYHRFHSRGSGATVVTHMSNWLNAVVNSFEIFSDEFRCITMDQRNANGGESTGPIPASDPWDAFADDQLGLKDHLGIKQFLFIGYCIGGCFAG